MSDILTPTRRDAVAAGIAAAAALGVVPAVHAAGDDNINVALIGCGGRGTGAAVQALNTKSGPIKLTAMADVFKGNVENAYKNIKRAHDKTVDVPVERRFVGFDGYKKAMDALKPGDIAIFATPVAFRGLHFDYAIKKGLHVFMEKPTTIDGPSTRRMLKLAEEATKKNLKVGVGLMCRHCAARDQLVQLIRKGEIGDIISLRAYRQAGYTASAFSKKNPGPMSDLMYQIRNFHSFLWLSGGAYSDFLIHNIDECCWIKGEWPVEVKASGGRHHREDWIDQNFDTYSVEYVFADGARLHLEGRTMPGATNEFASYVHGSKASAVISKNGHTPARCEIYKGQKLFSRQDRQWQAMKDEPDPYQLEWDHLVAAIRKDTPYNEAKRGAEASLVTAMGRKAAHTGQKLTFAKYLEDEEDLAPIEKLEKLTLDGDSILMPDKAGKYPVPMPGVKRDREY